MLSILAEATAPMALADLAREVCRRADCPATDDVRRCQLQLYHHHIPKMAAAGILEFDRDRRTVALTT